MIKIDNALLQEIGLGSLPTPDKDSLLKHIYETLEMRVGMRLADQMSNEQLDEFEKYFEAKDDAGAFKWLEANFPNYKDIVQEEFDKLKLEVSQAAPQILASAQPQSPQNEQQQGLPTTLQNQPYTPVSDQPLPYQPAPQLPPNPPQYAQPQAAPATYSPAPEYQQVSVPQAPQYGAAPSADQSYQPQQFTQPSVAPVDPYSQQPTYGAPAPTPQPNAPNYGQPADQQSYGATPYSPQLPQDNQPQPPSYQ